MSSAPLPFGPIADDEVLLVPPIGEPNATPRKPLPRSGTLGSLAPGSLIGPFGHVPTTSAAGAARTAESSAGTCCWIRSK